MADERMEQLIEIFDAASELSGMERKDYLAMACGGDGVLRTEVEWLLRQHDEADDFLEQPVLPDASQKTAGLAGRQIGPYKLLRELGSGGMGVVYLAVRADDVYQKEVAVKLVATGWQREDVIRRFKQERRILARLDHPNIARLLDGGTTEEGWPYVVMEYVNGAPISDYCDAHKLSVTERLKLFRTACAAVEYAHRNLIVHRDLKPGNIFVTPVADGKAGTVKLLDFGIAKLLAPEPQTADLTRTGLHLLTPEYASPEQMRGETVTTAGFGFHFLLPVEGFEVLRPARDNLFSLPFGQMRRRVLIDFRDQVVKGVLACNFNGSPPDTVRVTFQGQIERGVKWMQALDSALAIAGTRDGDRADKRFDLTCLETLMSSLFKIGPNDRLVDGCGGNALIDVSLQQMPKHLETTRQKQVFQLMEFQALRRAGLQLVTSISNWSQAA